MEQPKPSNAAQDEMSLIHQIRKELSLESSQDAVKLVASVLQALRQTFTLDQANDFLNMLPDFFKIAFTTNWEQREQRAPVKHLDEFVSLVMERDDKYKTGLFRNEVQTLSAIILTLKKLSKVIDLDSFDGISPALRQELRGLPSEAAA